MRARFVAQPRQTRREMVSGESHYFQGRRYRLRVVKSNGAAKIVRRNNSTLELQVRPETTVKGRERILQQWYRQHLRELIPTLLEKWQTVLGVHADKFGIKKMKTKWGTCNIDAKRVWLNLELVKKAPHCLEYVIVHELVHFFERNHSDRFVALLDQKLPQWRLIRDELNAAPLAHEEWSE